MAQNTVQNANDLYSADEILYIADYIADPTDDSITDFQSATWTNIGALSEFAREGANETSQPPSQNVEHTQTITKQQSKITFGVQELNADNLVKLASGIIKKQVVASTTVSGATQTSLSGAWDVNIAYKIENQNGDKTAPTINSVIGATDGALTANDDYDIIKVGDEWYIVFQDLASATNLTTTSQDITINYDYTPNAQTRMYSVETDVVTPLMFKVVTVEADGRVIETYYPRVELSNPGDISDKAQDSGEFKDIKFEFTAKLHDNYTYSGNKVLKVDNEIAV